MAITYTDNGGGVANNSKLEFTYSFPVIQTEDVKVALNGVTQATTKYTVDNVSNPTHIEFNNTSIDSSVQEATGAPKTGVRVRVYRETTVGKANGNEDPKAVFAAGSSIRAIDLNANQEQSLMAIHELQDRPIETEDLQDSAITSAKIEDGTIVNADIANTTITGAKLVNDTITSTQIAANAVTAVELADDAVDTDAVVDDAVTYAKIQNVSATDRVLGRDSSGAGVIEEITPTNLRTMINVEDGATADQTAAEIRTLVESATDSNVFTDADHSKLNNIEAGATADQTAAEIRTLVESATDSNVFTNADHVKLNSVETGATADQTNAEIKTAYEANADTNEFSDAEQSKLAGIETAATADQTASEIKTLLQSDKLTISEMNTTSLDGRYFTETESDARYFRQDSSETISSGNTWSNSDAFVATTAAINARIVDLIDDVGGFTAITSEQHFPDTNPQGSTGQAAILSIQSASTTLTPSGTTVTISNGNLANNANIIITGVTATIPSGFGFLVESTSTLHTYAFHRLVPNATQVTTVANNITNIVNAGANVTDINNFADLYIISSSQPSNRNDGSSLQEGDLWYDSSNDNLLVYTGSAFSVITPSQSVLDDVAIVSGAITYSEDLGLITDAASTGSSNGSLDIVADALEDEVTFTVTAATGKFIIDGVDKPALTLYKGWTYTFDVSDASNANHPLRFQSGGSAYNTGVTVTGTQGQAGAKVQLVVPESQPTSFQYYCTSHSGMGNTITVKDDPIKTVSDNISSITTVASDLNEGTSEIDTVATNITNVNNVGNNISNVNSVHNNATNINSAVSNANNINTVAGAISNINTVASNVSGINDFADRYRVDSSAPGSNNDAGDLYFDTTSNELRVYNGSAWQGGVTATGNLAGLGANTFTGNQTINANIIVSGTVDGKDVSTLIANTVEDTTPQLGGTLDGQNNNMSNIGTIDGTNLQLDFGTL